MTLTLAKQRFEGFTRWHNRMVRKEYRSNKATLWEVYGSELMNTGTIELPSRQTISGHPEIWQ